MYALIASTLSPMLMALMTMAEKLPHPATSFNTSGHILGNDSFLNGAFLTRMLMTNHGFQPDAVEGSDIAMARDKYSQVMDQWGKVCTLISQLGKWDDWKKGDRLATLTMRMRVTAQPDHDPGGTPGWEHPSKEHPHGRALPPDFTPKNPL